jgi:hypothetical protein
MIPDYVHEHFKKYPIPHTDKRFTEVVRPAIVCKDGFVISVQASRSHYCTPKTNMTDRYIAVEVFSQKNGKWTRRWPEGWVSVEKVNKRIHRHGGPVYEP